MAAAFSPPSFPWMRPPHATRKDRGLGLRCPQPPPFSRLREEVCRVRGNPAVWEPIQAQLLDAPKPQRRRGLSRGGPPSQHCRQK